MIEQRDEKDSLSLAIHSYIMATLADEHFAKDSGLITCQAVGVKLEQTDGFKRYVDFINQFANELEVQQADICDFLDELSQESKKLWQSLPAKNQNKIASLMTTSVTMELMQKSKRKFKTHPANFEENQKFCK